RSCHVIAVGIPGRMNEPSGKHSSKSWEYITTDRAICRLFDMQVVWRAFSLACAKIGNRMAAKMAIIAMTISSSMRVNAVNRRARWSFIFIPFLWHNCVKLDSSNLDQRWHPPFGVYCRTFGGTFGLR